MAKMVPTGGRSTARVRISTSENVEVVPTFNDMGLRDGIVSSLRLFGFSKPTDVQKKAVKPMIVGRDVIVKAQSGTGKTAAASIAILHSIVHRPKDVRVLCVSPTEEQAAQFKRVVLGLGNILNRDNLFGTDHCQLNIDEYVDCGTPEHVFNMIKCDAVRIQHTKILVLDKVDKMLNKGFLEQLYEIRSLLPSATQVILLFETLSKSMLKMTQKFMSRPIKVLIKRDRFSLNGIKQYYVITSLDKWKVLVLIDLYNKIFRRRAVVFCSSKDTVNWLSMELRRSDFTVSAVHEDLSDIQRDMEIKKFYSETTKILVANDILTRDDIGIFIPLTINFNLPTTEATYIYRTRLSGTINHRHGIVINFVKYEDLNRLQKIEEYFSTQISEMPMSIAKYL